MQHDLEGFVLKKANSSYQVNTRSHDWLKVINYKYKDVAITGMLKKDHSFLLSSLYDGKIIGIMGFVPPQERKKIFSQINGTKESNDIIYFNQRIVCNVKFRNWTRSGKLRIPSFHKWIS